MSAGREMRAGASEFISDEGGEKVLLPKKGHKIKEVASPFRTGGLFYLCQG